MNPALDSRARFEDWFANNVPARFSARDFAWEAWQAAIASTAPEHAKLERLLNAAAGEGYVLDGVDAADLYVALFPAEYEAALRGEPGPKDTQKEISQ